MTRVEASENPRRAWVGWASTSAAAIRIAPLTRAYAQDIATWRYDPPYDVYDMAGADPDDLLDPELGFHAVLAGDRLIGFRSFGPDGRVPGWDYDDSALDMARTTPWTATGPR